MQRITRLLRFLTKSYLVPSALISISLLSIVNPAQADDPQDKNLITFKEHILPMLTQRCMPCHTRNFYSAEKEHGCRGLISFDDRAIGSKFYGGPNDGKPTGCPDKDLYERLTQLNSPACLSMKYIQPGSPEKSLLYVKMTGGVCPEKKDPLHPPPADFTLKDIQLLRKWIIQGALK